MLLIRILLFILSVHRIKGQLQINLYLTDWTSGDEQYDGLLHDCLYATSATMFDREPYQVIPYCLSEWPAAWKIQKNDIDPKFTFAQLALANITSDQLYIWSAPMDVIQRYQHYLDKLSDPTTEVMATELFYNCTLPDFGPSCEYRLSAYKSHQSSLDEIVNEFYRDNAYKPTSLTCYVHLRCHRGLSSSCLDWSEICDGKVDCLDGGLDETDCWRMEINECDENEFRCLDGQCIPIAFLREIEFHYDCLDLSDGSLFHMMLPSIDTKFSGEPTFGYEDVSCAKVGNFYINRISSSCVVNRDTLLFNELFSLKPVSIESDECWTGFKCIIHMPISEERLCREFCINGICDDIVKNTCPALIFTTALPILLSHVFVIYENNELRYADNDIPQPSYICYNSTLLHLPDTDETLILPDNMTCRSHNTSIINHSGYKPGWIQLYIDPLYRWLQIWLSWIHNDSMLCHGSNVYQCIDSYKCISKHRLLDGFQDCYHNDDEDVSMLNKNCSTQNSSNYFECKTTHECVPHRLVHDGVCHCTEHQTMNDVEQCDDEVSEGLETRAEIAFPLICDGYTHLYPTVIDDRYHTDETDCEQWPCNNIYTRCNKFWNCANGADELNCNSSPVLECSSNSHICGSLKTNQLICLPLEQANDGIVDCIGAADEPILCRMRPHDFLHPFHCTNHSRRSCIGLYDICDGISDCKNGDDEQICSSISDDGPTEEFCNLHEHSIEYDSKNVFCDPFASVYGTYALPTYFQLEEMSHMPQKNVINEINNVNSHQSLPKIENSQQQCHRGLDLQVWLDKDRNLTRSVCLCPPSFYGNHCQYQNQRISVTIQFLVSSDSIDKLIITVISLMDKSDQRLIHSHEQITYLSKQYCRKKFNFYLLYSTRPRNESTEYFIHIDIYERKTFIYRGSFIKTILFPFLPVYRLAFQLNIPSIHDKPENCVDRQCRNGECRRYVNDPDRRTFCQCDPGWSGRYCNIPHNCTCSSDSLCLGKFPNNQSICVCPLGKIGSRCLINNSILCSNQTCLNGGQCLLINKYRTIYQQSICICSTNFNGERCEIPQTKIIISFDKNIVVPTAIHVHFIEVPVSEPPQHTIHYKKIPFGQSSITIYWPYTFHLVFIEWDDKYYLSILQKRYNQSVILERSIHLSDRCLNVNELFNETILNSHLLHRIKYYHLSCQRNPFQYLSCFYDEIHLCLCQYHHGQYVANCFKFAHNKTKRCLSKSGCMHGGYCIQDNLICPTTSLCVCPECYYGAQCQLNTYGFGLSLDAILAPHIQPKYNIARQSRIVTTSLIVTLVLIVLGSINGLLSWITFKNNISRESGCGIYLLCSSIIILLTMLIFALKFFILLFSHIQLFENELFSKLQCHSIDFLLRFCLIMDQWLTACVSIERAFIVIKGLNFDRKKTRRIAKWIILGLVLFVIGTTIQDPIHRKLHIESNDEQKRIWCIVEYSSPTQTFNLVMSIFHLVFPFTINIISAVIIIVLSTRQQKSIQVRKTYKQILNEEIRKHKNLLIGPSGLVFLAIPRIITSFASGCLKSANDSWLFLFAYYTSLFPALLTFVIFILPSTTYTQAFKKAINL